VDLAGRSNVLVAYASARGSTRGIAERIAARLSDRGARVEVRSVDDVDDIVVYDTVIIASAVYSQSWLPNAGSGRSDPGYVPSPGRKRNRTVLRYWHASISSGSVNVLPCAASAAPRVLV
jgi:hypothetical protein